MEDSGSGVKLLLSGLEEAELEAEEASEEDELSLGTLLLAQLAIRNALARTRTAFLLFMFSSLGNRVKID